MSRSTIEPVDPPRVGRDASGSGGLKVVLAGNDPLAMTRVCDALEEAGFLVVAKVHTAKQAIEAVLRHHPQVCLLEADVVGDSLDASRQIRFRTPETKIALIAASAPEQEVFRAIEMGVDGYLLKSISKERLAAALRAVGRGEPALPRAVVARLVAQLRESAERTRPHHGALNRTLLYVPRFIRHLFRRLRADMPVSAAWHSARARMWNYRDPA